MVEKDLRLTPKGYRFLVDMSSRVLPVLIEYSLWTD